jgi:hypothetical protein
MVLIGEVNQSTTNWLYTYSSPIKLLVVLTLVVTDSIVARWPSDPGKA